MIYHQPTSFRRGMDDLRKSGFQPETFVPQPTMGEHLAQFGVRTLAFQHYTISHSGLSQMLFREADVRAFSTPAQLWFNVRQALTEPAHEKQYFWVYWGPVDGLQHITAHATRVCWPNCTRLAGRWNATCSMRSRPMNGRKPCCSSPRIMGTFTLMTTLIFTCAIIRVCRKPSTFRRAGKIACRLMYLYPRAGYAEAMLDYFANQWPDAFTLVPSTDALEAGLLGTAPQRHPEIMPRVGDWMALARGAAYLWWDDKPNHLIGRHGGLSRAEMLVPLLAARLDE